MAGSCYRRQVRLLGALGFILFAPAAFYCVAAICNSRRPRDVIFAALAPLCAIAAIIALVCVFVPGFL